MTSGSPSASTIVTSSSMPRSLPHSSTDGNQSTPSPVKKVCRSPTTAPPICATNDRAFVVMERPSTLLLVSSSPLSSVRRVLAAVGPWAESGDSSLWRLSSSMRTRFSHRTDGVPSSYSSMRTWRPCSSLLLPSFLLCCSLSFRRVCDTMASQRSQPHTEASLSDVGTM